MFTYVYIPNKTLLLECRFHFMVVSAGFRFFFFFLGGVLVFDRCLYVDKGWLLTFILFIFFDKCIFILYTTRFDPTRIPVSS